MPEEAWKQALTELRGKTQDLSAELLKARISRVDGSGLILTMPDPAVLEQIRSNYGPAIQSRMASILGRPISLKFELQSPPEESAAHQAFDTFITGEKNLLAYKAVCSVQKHKRPSPLVLEGASGCGKTHLLRSLAAAQRAQGMNVLCLDSVELRDRFLAALHQRRVPELKQQWRDCDAMLIDDLQLLASAPATLEEVSHLVAQYLDASKPVVVTSDRPMAAFLRDARLLSRLNSGLTAFLDYPDAELRYNMVRQIADNLSVSLERAQMEHIAESGTTYRSLFSAVSSIALEGGETAGPKDMDRVVEAVCLAFRITPDELLGNSRKSEHAGPRHAAMVLALRYTDTTKSSIARFFRKKDHTTVIHAEKTVAAKLRTSPVFRTAFENAVRRLSVDNMSDSADKDQK